MIDKNDLELAKTEKISAPLWKEDDLAVTDEFIGHPISLKRFATTLICSFLFFQLYGLYLLYWGCRHFRPFIRAGTSGSFNNLVCALFFPFWFFKLTSLYDKRATNRQISLRMHKYLLPTSYLILEIGSGALPIGMALLLELSRSKAGMPWYVDYVSYALELLSFIPLFVFQHKVNQLNAQLHPGKPFYPPATKLDKVAIIACVVIGVTYRLLWPKL